MNLPKLEERLDAYLRHMEICNQSPIHRRQLRFNVLRTIRWLAQVHGVVRAEQLTAVHLDGWFHHILNKRTRSGRPLKPSSSSKQFQCDRAFIAWLCKAGVVPAGLSESLPKVKQPQLLPTSILAHEKMVRLLERIKTDTPAGYRLRTMFEILYTSGMRVAELLGLDLDSLDLSTRLIRVRGKGDKERMVPIGATAARFLENYLRGIRPLLQRDPNQLALFLDDGGQRMPYHTFRRQLCAVRGEANVEFSVTAHTFRRSCATELVRSGANLWYVAMLLGHDRVETLKHYVGVTAVDLKKAHAKHHPRERERG